MSRVVKFSILSHSGEKFVGEEGGIKREIAVRKIEFHLITGT